MRVLHTSDWHLGQQLLGQSRLQESQAFLDWLVDTITNNEVDVLVVAGDIFDSTVPSNRALTQFFNFLDTVRKRTNCSNIVVVGGNHDSPSLLNAPKAILEHIGIHIIGSALSNPADEVLLLRDQNNQPIGIIGAVPYLRDRDVRRVFGNETRSDKEDALLAGIKEHYQLVAEQAKHLLKQEGNLPCLATGHLFAQGGCVQKGDEVRELYIGNLSRVTADTFDPVFQYVALGHLHQLQEIAKSQRVFYSGAPYPMSFDECHSKKSVILVNFKEDKLSSVETITVPVFQTLEQIEGTVDAIYSKLLELCEQNSSAWVDIHYTGDEIISNLRERLLKNLKSNSLNILRIRDDARRVALLTSSGFSGKNLDELKPEDVFEKRLKEAGIPEAQCNDLRSLFSKVLHTYLQKDSHF